MPTNFSSTIGLKKCSLRETSSTICWMNFASCLCVKDDSIRILRIPHEMTFMSLLNTDYKK
ncbi:hypothetical protein Hanom_Chr09g00773111 [Helianthus anomalus]